MSIDGSERRLQTRTHQHIATAIAMGVWDLIYPRNKTLRRNTRRFTRGGRLKHELKSFDTGFGTRHRCRTCDLAWASRRARLRITTQALLRPSCFFNLYRRTTNNLHLQQGCQSYLWGGHGVPSYDDEGRCSCSCEDNWRTANVIGHACCVPPILHVVFTSAGLALSLVQLVHAAYNLKQQRLSEVLKRGRGNNVKMLVEVYREHLSIISIIHAPVIGLYFALTLWLPEEGVQWCAMVLGVSHCFSGVGAVLTVQILTRSVDPRLLKKGAVVLQVSAALTHPVGRFVSYSAVSIGGLVLVYFASLSMTGKGYEVASVAYILVTVIRILVLSACSWSMVQMINKSILQQAGKKKLEVTGGSGPTDAPKTAVRKVDPKLVAARTTILSALFFCVSLTSIASAALLYALVTERGIENPLVFMATPLAFGPMLALTFHIQIHSKRNRVSARDCRSPTSAHKSPRGIFSTSIGAGRKKENASSFTASSGPGKWTRRTTSGRVAATETAGGEEEINSAQLSHLGVVTEREEA